MRIFDSHLHIIDPRFPLVGSQGYRPDPFTCADYGAWAAKLGIVGGAVVSGSFQGFDQSYLLAALETLGPTFVGVTQLPASVSEAEIRRLDRAGVRAVRFNLKRGGSAGVADLKPLAARVHALAGWHVELYVDGRDLPALFETLVALPAVVIDHLGLAEAGLPSLLRLIERGASVKASGFGRLDFAPGPVLRQVAAINPEALLFGTDLPSTRAPRPFQEADLALLRETLAPPLAARALHDNAVAWYRPRRVAAGPAERSG
jgi:predicted TIM-barrel fold metal-dependent hydrolase